MEEAPAIRRRAWIVWRLSWFLAFLIMSRSVAMGGHACSSRRTMRSTVTLTQRALQPLKRGRNRRRLCHKECTETETRRRNPPGEREPYSRFGPGGRKEFYSGSSAIRTSLIG